MSSDKQKLLLTELEAEVIQEALELYLRARPASFDHRFEYMYRAARTVLEGLRLGAREVGTLQRGDDDEARVIDDELSDRRPPDERRED